MDDADRTPRALTCRELAAFVMDYLDGALPAAERAAFEAHLAECPECVVYLRSYRDTVRLAKTHGVPDDARAADMPEDLVDAILAARRRRDR
jgi:anti-sigma factor RsiW